MNFDSFWVDSDDLWVSACVGRCWKERVLPKIIIIFDLPSCKKKKSRDFQSHFHEKVKILA